MRNSMFKLLIAAAVVMVAILPFSGVFATQIGDNFDSYGPGILASDLPTTGFSFSNTTAETLDLSAAPFVGVQGVVLVYNPEATDIEPEGAVRATATAETSALTVNMQGTFYYYNFDWGVIDTSLIPVPTSVETLSGDRVTLYPSLDADFVGIQVNGYLNGTMTFSDVSTGTIDAGAGAPFVTGTSVGGNEGFDTLVIYMFTDNDGVFDDFIFDDVNNAACLFTDGRLNNDPSKDCAPVHVDYCDGTTLTVRDIDGLELLQVPVSDFGNPPAEGSVIVASGNGIIVSQDDSTNVYVTGWEADPFWGDGLKPYVIKINQACTTGQNVSPLNP